MSIELLTGSNCYLSLCVLGSMRYLIGRLRCEAVTAMSAAVMIIDIKSHAIDVKLIIDKQAL